MTDEMVEGEGKDMDVVKFVGKLVGSWHVCGGNGGESLTGLKALSYLTFPLFSTVYEEASFII